MEVEMKIMTGTGTLLVMCLGLGAANSARAAGTYALTCDAANGAKVSMTLTGFTFKVTNSGSGSGETSVAGATAGKRETSDTTFELTIRFAPGKDYETFLSMAQDNENLRSCKLTDGDSGGTSASDSWTQNAVTKGKSKNKNNNEPAAASTGGALEWILTNARVTSVTATGNENASGAPQGSMEATLEAQTFSFAD
jgi:hypothetical protein